MGGATAGTRAPRPADHPVAPAREGGAAHLGGAAYHPLAVSASTASGRYPGPVVDLRPAADGRQEVQHRIAAGLAPGGAAPGGVSAPDRATDQPGHAGRVPR